MVIMNPVVRKNILNEDDFSVLLNYISSHPNIKDNNYDGYGRKLIGGNGSGVLESLHNKLTDLAREIFQSKTLVPTYSLFAEYSGKDVLLDKHTDSNACTYTIDLVVYQNKPWGLWINNEEYIAFPNEAIFFMGEDQEHWREVKHNNEDVLGVVFFHYVEPDHWWFTKGPEYVEVIRRNKGYG